MPITFDRLARTAHIAHRAHCLIDRAQSFIRASEPLIARGETDAMVTLAALRDMIASGLPSPQDIAEIAIELDRETRDARRRNWRREYMAQRRAQTRAQTHQGQAQAHIPAQTAQGPAASQTPAQTSPQANLEALPPLPPPLPLPGHRLALDLAPNLEVVDAGQDQGQDHA